MLVAELEVALHMSSSIHDTRRHSEIVLVVHATALWIDVACLNLHHALQVICLKIHFTFQFFPELVLSEQLRDRAFLC